jgi:epoxyqueuosine reductase QueG
MNYKQLASEYGFAECYVLSTEPFTHYERRLKDGALHSGACGLTTDLRRDAPWANAVLTLVYPYRPYADSIPVSGNYPSSNRSYHAAGGLMKRLKELDIRAERAEVPIRELLLRNGLGSALKNGLTYLPGYGTRYSVQALLVALPQAEYEPPRKPEAVRCVGCHACERICPSGAIDGDGYHFKKCARAYMGGEAMEEWVMDSLTSVLGCELCQRVCPYNFAVTPIEDMPDAFRLEELLRGNVKPALEIVGKNLNKQGRLIQHACIVAARQGRTDLIPLLEPLLEDRREGVRVAAKYALDHLHCDKG